MRELIKSQPVVILPIGSVEDHGPHLPIDTDNFLIWSICEAAPGEILLMPQIPFGFETHHLDFPGMIDITADHLLNFVLDVTRSVVRYGKWPGHCGDFCGTGKISDEQPGEALSEAPRCRLHPSANLSRTLQLGDTQVDETKLADLCGRYRVRELVNCDP